MTKREFKARVRSSVHESLDVLGRRLDHLIKSGAIDLETASPTTCKAAVRAFLLDEADQFIPLHIAQEKKQLRRFKREVNNMRIMM